MSGFVHVTTSSRHRHANAAEHVDPRLRLALNAWLGLGMLAVALLPAARGSSLWLGWMPLWLVLMPASANWAMHRFRLPRWPQAVAAATRQRRRRSHGQARRLRHVPMMRTGLARAA